MAPVWQGVAGSSPVGSIIYLDFCMNSKNKYMNIVVGTLHYDISNKITL